MKKVYKVWADSESSVDIPNDLIPCYDDLDTACDIARFLAHEHDGESYRAIFHVDDTEYGETIDTYENLIGCDK